MISLDERMKISGKTLTPDVFQKEHWEEGKNYIVSLLQRYPSSSIYGLLGYFERIDVFLWALMISNLLSETQFKDLVKLCTKVAAYHLKQKFPNEHKSYDSIVNGTSLDNLSIVYAMDVFVSNVADPYSGHEYLVMEKMAHKDLCQFILKYVFRNS